MNMPDKIVIHDRDVAYFWVDEHGILNVKSKGVPRSAYTVQQNGEFIRSLLNGKKVPCIYDISQARPLGQSEREIVKRQLPELYSAVAIITRSAMGNMLGSVLSVITPPSVPTKMFADAKEARDWVMQYR